MSPRSILALDIGGANLKLAHSSGTIRSVPFPLWKNPQGLSEALGTLMDGLVADRLAVTMTGELCDCFITKKEGVATILGAVRKGAFPESSIAVWGTDGLFHSLDEIEKSPEIAAASNWLALATMIARIIPDGLLIDVGSTTCDIIPIRNGQPTPQGRTDPGRLRSGELIYAGVKRTPICALSTSLPHRGHPTGLMAELFATTHDVYLTLGDIAEDPDDTSTADGRPATRVWSRDRLARMVGEDRTSFSEHDAADFARLCDSSLMDRLTESAMRVWGGITPYVVVSGSGEFLARRVAERVVTESGSVVSLSERWGRDASDAACAHALMILAGDIA